MSSWKKTLFPAFVAAALPVFGAGETAVWNFDSGENIDAQTGMTEFSRQKTFPFKGLVSEGTRQIALEAASRVDPGHLFADSARKKALRIGADSASGTCFSVHGTMKKPLSGRQGTVAFWIKPENWSGNTKGNFRIFLAADDGAAPRSNELLLYKNAASNHLIFLIGNNKPEEWSKVQQSIWNWKEGEWHFLCAVWKPSSLLLCVDGKIVEVPRKNPPDRDYTRLHLGTRNWKAEDGLSLMDDLMIFEEALTPEAMDEIYRKTRPVTAARKSPMEFRLGLTTPVPDGKIGNAEYGIRSNAFFNIKTMAMTSSCRWALSRDREKLYFACDTPKPVRKPAHAGRDGKIWEDESIEIHLEHKQKKWQFIVNSAGALFDAQDNNPGWNIRNFEQIHAITGERWVFETAISFRDLGITPQEGDIFYATICRSIHRSELLGASPLRRRFTDQENYFKLLLDAGAPPVAIHYRRLPGDAGKLEMEVQTAGDAETVFQVTCADARGRRLFSKTVVPDGADHGKKALVVAGNLAKEGILSYRLTREGVSLAAASLNYLSPDKVRVRYLRTRMKEGILESALVLNPPLNPGMRLSLQLKRKNGGIVLKQDTVIGKENAEKSNLLLTWDLAKLPPGEYDYCLVCTEGGESRTVHRQYFLKPSEKMPWDDFRGGIESTPPPPWHTPVRSETRLRCLTQEYDFSKGLLPAGIQVQGHPLLASPMQLRINGTVAGIPASFETVKETPTALEFKTTGSWRGYTFKVNGRLEYDGWCRLALTYGRPTPDAETGIHDLALIIPMKEKYSGLFTSFKPLETGHYSGRLGRHQEKDLMEHPVFWIGDADYGLFWGADNLRGTHLEKTEKSLVITRKDESAGAVATVRLVDGKVRFKGSRTVSFAIQGTPVKEPRGDLAKPWLLRGGASYTNSAFLKVFNYYNRKYMNLKDLAAQLEAAKKRREPLFAFYACVYGVSPFAPEWPWYSEEWISSPPGPGQFKQDFPLNDEASRNRGMWAFGCMNSTSFRNWQLYYMADIIRDPAIGLRDMYFDMAYPRSCDNPEHGCGWYDDFRILRKTFPIQANREFTKRIRKLLRDKDPASVLMYHPSGEPLPPLCGLVDFVVDGELFVSRVAREESYFKIFTPELFQSTLTGTKCGTHNVYLAQFNRSAMLFNPARSEYWRRKNKTPEALRAVRHFLGYLLLHNVRPQSGVCIYNEAVQLERLLYSIGWGGPSVEFHPYWRKDGPVRSTGGTLVSAFTFPGKLLAVVLNDRDRKTVAAITAPEKYKGRIYDLESGSELKSARAEVPGKGFRLLVFEEKEK